MKNIIKLIVATCVPALLLKPVLLAQERTDTLQAASFEAYDPLIPQLFAFDKKNDIFAGINNVDNKIVLVRRKGTELSITHSYLVDNVSGRHDTEHIYRPKSVAIYEDHVVFLASHRDSCYLAVLDLNGILVQKLRFPGEASAFSYSASARELYISGENVTGFDVIALDASRGMNRINLENAASLHYQKPRLSEVIAVRDPWGVGMSVIAMSVVFLALLMLYLVFKQVGVQLISIQDRRNRKVKKISKAEAIASTGDISGDVYAAITAAIHLYNEELHDEENTVLTIHKVSRAYSPWSSKIHGLNTYFNR
ncbi:MAG: OadG family protein [Bacteroidales bacterium]|jgi:Na+-transporting methylmalonyl-CoA/oxaloacetate decarboxylase gamma subunit|nr:OadG family protein [Bacteroidales bacterium]